jgi:NhaP-type Na+/H+ or K+/H+ antiporter
MTAVLAFAVTLMLGVLISELADRSVLSTSVLFLAAGVVVGDGGLGVVSLSPDAPVVATLAELALFSVLFTDGMRVGIRDIVSAWHLPGRALFFGLPLTLVGTALVAYAIVGLPWPESLLLGAVLCPTDPVFAAAIVGREEVPERLRGLLNVESGLNDGLALPLVVGLLAYAGRGEFEPGTLALELALGVGIGVVIPWAAISLERTRFFASGVHYEPLFGFSIGLLVLAASSLTHANEYLAAFAAGITIATLEPSIRHSFHEFGGLVAELLKLAALMVFGALISPSFLAEIPLGGYVFAAVALLAVRPIALGVSLVGSPLDGKERLTAAWFGPKGFASVVFGLLVLRSGLARSDELFHLIALVVVGSIIAHSSTDVMVARWFRESEAQTPSPPPAEPQP